MQFVRASLVLTAVAILLPVAAQAQSLGEIAAKERQKREAQKKPPAKVLTEADLERAKGSSASIDVGTPGQGEVTTQATPEAGGTKPEGTAEKKVEGEKSAEELQAEELAAWRNKTAAAEKKLKTYQELQTKLQSDLNDPNLSQYSPSRQTIVSLLDDAKKNIFTAQAELEALAAEGRSKAYRR